MRHVSVLENRWVRLEPLSLEHVAGLSRAASADRSTYSLASVPETESEMESYVREALEAAQAGTAFPFAIVDKLENRGVVGSTRLFDLQWWRWPASVTVSGEPRRREDGMPPNSVEIGHTWLAESAQRSAVNTACKLLLLSHVFDVWQVHRVTLKTDARNSRSRRAIEGIGGQFEGILRAHMPASDGTIRDTAMYSILPGDWPSIRPRLEQRLAAGGFGS